MENNWNIETDIDIDKDIDNDIDIDIAIVIDTDIDIDIDISRSVTGKHIRCVCEIVKTCQKDCTVLQVIPLHWFLSAHGITIMRQCNSWFSILSCAEKSLPGYRLYFAPWHFPLGNFTRRKWSARQRQIRPGKKCVNLFFLPCVVQERKTSFVALYASYSRGVPLYNSEKGPGVKPRVYPMWSWVFIWG